jgi:hypothetical protein
MKASPKHRRSRTRRFFVWVRNMSIALFVLFALAGVSYFLFGHTTMTGPTYSTTDPATYKRVMKEDRNSQTIPSFLRERQQR